MWSAVLIMVGVLSDLQHAFALATETNSSSVGFFIFCAILLTTAIIWNLFRMRSTQTQLKQKSEILDSLLEACKSLSFSKDYLDAAIVAASFVTRMFEVKDNVSISVAFKVRDAKDTINMHRYSLAFDNTQTSPESPALVATQIEADRLSLHTDPFPGKTLQIDANGIILKSQRGEHFGYVQVKLPVPQTIQDAQLRALNVIADLLAVTWEDIFVTQSLQQQTKYLERIVKERTDE